MIYNILYIYLSHLGIAEKNTFKDRILNFSNQILGMIKNLNRLDSELN